MSIKRLLEDAEARLAAVSDSARLDAELLLALALGKDRSFLIAHRDEPVATEVENRFDEFLDRRGDGEPVAYITGVREFWSLPIAVSEATLVPRPETERLVELALELIDRHAMMHVADLGTGSGAIALAIASERPGCQVTAVDNSRAALTVAEANARKLDIDNVRFVLGNWTAGLDDAAFDLVVSNPPYIRDGDPALEALRREPQCALVSGAEGLDDIHRLAKDVPRVLSEDGKLLLEHGADQSGAVAGILEAAGWRNIRHFDDHAGRARVTGAVRG